MKTILLASLVLSMHASFAATTSWDNPAVMCPEEILVRGLTCPDLSRVDNPYTDFPDETTKEQITDWRNNKAADLKYCRNAEVLRRESVKAGSFTPATIEQAWMVVDGGKNVPAKLAAIQAATLKYEIPAQVLIGAMKQESLMSSLGVSPDGGNYSCGMSQLNIQEWCSAMNSLSGEEKAKYGWPSDMSCEDDELPTTIVKPFYDIAVKNLGTRATYELVSEDFKGITSEQVVPGFPSGSSGLQSKRYQAVTSFVNNCQDIALSVNFKARTLRGLYDNFVPSKLKEQEIYTAGKTFPRACKNTYASKYYPLHTGWLMAVAMYNAGPSQSKIVGYYYQAKSSELPAMNPLDLIEALHWGGKYKSGTDNVTYNDMDAGKKPGSGWFKKGSEGSLQQSWFKSCIVQRHVARVIQNVTLPAESIAKSLDQEGCKQSGVPAYRQAGTGMKAGLKEK
ncbi:MAG: hypothetical protein H7177_07115 [Rhizobacter sp.]|nr:hypothetical protein [Bacteriovorax sp.]